ncbi:uncharacterized protein LOC141629220 [Silene latifolia]|uniref:uncharacterized protein LOC141629220 n=1 Tax=Silene latifolia TaxID=37657 RepID=UPI003D781502
MEAHGITDWNTLALVFYKSYFPPQKTNAPRSQIIRFKQDPTNDLNETLVPFKRLVRSVPHHGFQIWFLCNEFYNGLYDDYIAVLDSSANGRFQNNTTDANAWKLIEEMVTNTAEYGNLREQVHAFQSFMQGTPYSNFFPERSQNVFTPTPQPNNAYVIPQNRENQPDNFVAQLSSQNSQRQLGTSPSHPGKPHEIVNAIHLRSGFTYDRPEMSRDGADLVNGELDVNVNDKIADPLPIADESTSNTNKKSNSNKEKKATEPLNVSVPVTELITQAPSYAKFMKEILTRNRSFDEVETIAFTEECSVLLQNKSPPKLADPGSFSIPGSIGTHTMDNALCDLGSSVSVLPLSLAKKIGLTEFKCTNMTVQIADRSLSRPLEILEDVPMWVGKFIIPVDFIVLDIPKDTHTPIILERPFLHTAGAIIDVGARTLTFKVGSEKLTYTQFSVRRAPMQVVPCHAVSPIEYDRVADSHTG